MTLQTKGFQWSVGIHGCILLIVFLLQVSAGAVNKMAVIDFTLSGGPPAPAVEASRHEPGPVQPRPAARKTASPVRKAQAAEPPSQALSLKEASPASAPQEVAGPGPGTGTSEQGSSRDAAHAGNARGVPVGNPGNAGEGKTRETLQAVYLKEHFLYIRERITKNIVYPPMARRMGWHGQVRIAFVVCEDGGVRDVRVVDSSGFGMLDRDAVDTVKNVAPFPRPPVKAEIRLAISYRLH